MKIQSVTFTNFKRLANQSFSCNAGLNVFVGANNSGKTSILQAMAMVMRLDKYYISTPSQFQAKRLTYRLQGTGDWLIGLGIQFDKGEWQNLIAAESTVNTGFISLLRNDELLEQLSQTTVALSTRWIIQDAKTVGGKVFSPLVPLPKFFQNPSEIYNLNVLQALVQSQDFYNAYGHPIFLDAQHFIPFKEPFRSKNEIMNERAEISNIRGRLFYLKQSDPDTFNELTEQLRTAFPELKSLDVRLNTDEGVFEFVLTEDIPVNGHSIEAEYDAADVGLGMQNLLILTANLLLLKPSVVLMDEPDVHMHPALVRDFVRILKQLSKQTQFFITTHNIAFIDALAPEDLFTVVYRPEEKGSVIRSVAERSEVIGAAEMLGFSLSNNVLLGKPKVYVFVEGESDSTYLLHFAKRLGYAKSVNAFNVQFVPMGGKGERSKVLSLIEKLGMTETPLVMVLDRDETSAEDIEILRKNYFQKHPERLVYWSRRQIENYLCVPSALQRILQAQPNASHYVAQIQELNIDTLLQELADKQQEAVLKRFLEHNVINYSLVRTEKIRDILKEIDISLPGNEYSQELASKLFAMMSKQIMKLGQDSTPLKTTFLERWNFPEQRVALCDGRRLLSDVRKEFQERGLFAAFSNDEIIAFCEAEDIHADIRSLLSQLHAMITTF